MLPRIKIDFLTGQLGTVGTSPDGLVALVVGATAVSSTFELGKSYELQSYQDLASLGVTKSNNPLLDKHVKDFYRQTPNGTKVIVCGVEASKKMAELLAKEDGEVRALIERHSGALRAVCISSEAGDSDPVTEGLSPDVYASLAPAQELAEWATVEMYAPLIIVIEGRGYTGKSLRDLSSKEYNRVGVLVGDTTALGKGACIGLLAGRIASIPVHRNVGRVRDGALKVDSCYLGTMPIEEKQREVIELHDKRYISLRRYVGREGYYFTDDNLACISTDDYAQIANRRVVDKAYRIAYDALLERLLEELELNPDGTMQAPILKAWEQAVETAINRAMTASGELSDEDGSGCVCRIDPAQNVLATGRVIIKLQVRPYAYARYIDVALGFLVTSNSDNK